MNGQPVYVFQYFNDRNNSYMKHRGIGKGTIKGGWAKHSPFWGMDGRQDKPLVTKDNGCNGGMAGWISNVVSVPNGSNNLMDRQRWEWLQGKRIHYIW